MLAMKPNGLAPVVLFVFARPDHTQRTIEALAANELAEQSNLIIYADAARNEGDIIRVQQVRALVHAVSGFRSVTVIERETNYGLARNIIEGVTEVCNHYGRVIVLEDDIVTNPLFLPFMNTALNRYANEPQVWHISGWNYPIDPDGLGDAFLWRVMNCWGWATWADRWAFFQKNPQRMIESWDKEKIKRFNLDGAYNFWGQVTANQKGKLNTWAIFWYATIFEKHGLCLNPAQSFVHNIGHDGSGENCGNTDIFAVNQLGEKFNDFPVYDEELTLAVQRIKVFCADMQPSFSKRLTRRAKNLIATINGFRQ
jgi:hypothetical protein